jgi:DNA polymerase-4
MSVLCANISSQPENNAIRKIIHIDMDAFFASVEQRDNADLRNKPVVVGGSPEQRGVVAAASYEARTFGIHSAMASKIAVQRCAHLIIVRPRFEVYRAISEQIREIFFSYTDLVEPLSLDEAYLDVTTNKRGLPSATLIAREIKARILEETSLTASAGVSVNKFLAKTASGINKPNGLCLIPPDKAETFAEQLAIEKFYGIGKVTAEKMRGLGVFTGADLKRWNEPDLIRAFGKVGSYYFNIVRGQDDRPVEPNRVRKSVGSEESYARDLGDREAIVAALREIADSVEGRLKRSETAGKTVTLKVKYADYQQVTRSRTMPDFVFAADELMRISLELLETTEVATKNVRLLGISLSNLDCEQEESDCVQLTLDFG